MKNLKKNNNNKLVVMTNNLFSVSTPDRTVSDSSNALFLLLASFFFSLLVVLSSCWLLRNRYSRRFSFPLSAQFHSFFLYRSFLLLSIIHLLIRSRHRLSLSPTLTNDSRKKPSYEVSMKLSLIRVPFTTGYVFTTYCLPMRSCYQSGRSHRC